MTSSLQLDKKTAEKLKKRASIASISLALGLSLLKLAAAVFSGSLAVLSSMIDSLSDVLGSFITYVAVKYSARPASYAHRYGYGKSEAVSALVQALFIAGSGLYVLCDAIIRFIEPQKIDSTPFAWAVMGFSLLSTLILIAYQKHIAALTHSQAILADSAHYVVDILTNSSILVSLLCVKFFNFIWFDTITAFFIAVYLVFNAYQLAKEALYTLLDHELDENIRNNVLQIIQRYPFVHGVHDLRTRSLGNDYMFELHLELDGRLSLFESHQLSDQVEAAIIKEYPHAQVIIHQDPFGIDEEHLDEKLSH